MSKQVYHSTTGFARGVVVAYTHQDEGYTQAKGQHSTIPESISEAQMSHDSSKTAAAAAAGRQKQALSCYKHQRHYLLLHAAIAHVQLTLHATDTLTGSTPTNAVLQTSQKLFISYHNTEVCCQLQDKASKGNTTAACLM